MKSITHSQRLSAGFGKAVRTATIVCTAAACALAAGCSHDVGQTTAQRQAAIPAYKPQAYTPPPQPRQHSALASLYPGSTSYKPSKPPAPPAAPYHGGSPAGQ